MTLLNLPPFLPFLIVAVCLPLFKGKFKSLILLLAPIWGLFNLWVIDNGTLWQWTILSLELTPVRIDSLSLIFGYAFHIAAFFSILFALHVKDTIQQLASLVYTSAALGAVFAGDLFTLFIFWELMAVSSVFLVWARRSGKAKDSGFRYLVYQLVSGLLLLAGAILYSQSQGTLNFQQMKLDSWATGMIFLAFGIKAGFPLLHTWLTDAYPKATISGTVFLSALTTKVAIYALARGFPGTEILIYIGAVMTCFPIFYAVIENDLRKVLAYSLINQLGFMVVGIGIGTQLAVNGAVAHAFNDILFKGLLFMTMGSVLQMTGRINASELGGLYKSMPKTTIACIIGAASISAFPLFNGFVSKAMVMTAVLNQGYNEVWLALLFASAGVFHHAGIKIPYFAFFGHDAKLKASDPPTNMLLAMFFAAGLCLAIGCYPTLLYQFLPYQLDYSPYDVTHVLAQTQLLFFAALAFAWMNLKGIYPPELASTNLDVDWLYRRLGPRIWFASYQGIRLLDKLVRRTIKFAAVQVLQLIKKFHKPDGPVAQAQTVSNMSLWIALLLGFYLLLSFT